MVLKVWAGEQVVRVGDLVCQPTFMVSLVRDCELGNKLLTWWAGGIAVGQWSCIGEKVKKRWVSGVIMVGFDLVRWHMYWSELGVHGQKLVRWWIYTQWGGLCTKVSLVDLVGGGEVAVR